MKPPGLYVPLDVNYVTDEGIRRAGPAAELLYIRALAYSKRTQSEGLLPDYDMPVISVGLPQVRESIASLVEWELWTPVEGGWQIRSWQRWNETQKEAADKRQRAADRQRRSRERRARTPPADNTDSDNPSGDDSSSSDKPPPADGRHADVTRDSRVTHTNVTPLKRREEKRRETGTSLVQHDPLKPPATRTKGTADLDFDRFWAAYPRRKAKLDATKAWKAALKRGATAEQLIEAATQYAAYRAGCDPQFTKLPATWLNKGAYDDEPDPAPAQQPYARTGTDDDDLFHRAMQRANAATQEVTRP
ncbi:hypothetical protein GCM10010193_69520 [Kitasatospora atroaurantiaca]|uniref:Uncharacterized protein n=1 Tax=Kitasatospora atroaurantiaca TaxID=285545 RepID=A0A561EN91_9ACTN|nr:hypothetical protein [Kitasatospora atroaurantiaca]TWE17039.1 hypothetical protein FB465_2043 [Kitasatospora atroaurantiaca]